MANDSAPAHLMLWVLLDQQTCGVASCSWAPLACTADSGNLHPTGSLAHPCLLFNRKRKPHKTQKHTPHTHTPQKPKNKTSSVCLLLLKNGQPFFPSLPCRPHEVITYYPPRSLHLVEKFKFLSASLSECICQLCLWVNQPQYHIVVPLCWLQTQKFEVTPFLGPFYAKLLCHEFIVDVSWVRNDTTLHLIHRFVHVKNVCDRLQYFSKLIPGMVQIVFSVYYCYCFCCSRASRYAAYSTCMPSYRGNLLNTTVQQSQRR